MLTKHPISHNISSATEPTCSAMNIIPLPSSESPAPVPSQRSASASAIGFVGLAQSRESSSLNIRKPCSPSFGTLKDSDTLSSTTDGSDNGTEPARACPRDGATHNVRRPPCRSARYQNPDKKAASTGDSDKDTSGSTRQVPREDSWKFNTDWDWDSSPRDSVGSQASVYHVLDDLIEMDELIEIDEDADDIDASDRSDACACPSGLLDVSESERSFGASSISIRSFRRSLHDTLERESSSSTFASSGNVSGMNDSWNNSDLGVMLDRLALDDPRGRSDST